MFGVEEPRVSYFAGTTMVDQFIESERHLPEVIAEGQRNTTLSAFAGRILTRLGDTDEAQQAFMSAADRCNPPLEESELESIWGSALDFYKNTVMNDPTYRSPEEFEFGSDKGFTLDDMKRVLHKMGIRIRLNVITGKTEIAGLGDNIEKGDAANVLPGRIRSYMNEKGIHCSRADMDDYLTNILAENHFNPVEKMVKLTTWDSVDRVAELLSIMGITEEQDKVLVRKWLHQCIAMALNDPASPYGADGVLVLQGEQGIGKTLLCSKLAVHPDWFAEGVSIDVTNKDSIIQASGVWIAELGELDSTLKKEQSALKAFLTAKVDTYRLPYGRAAVTKARRTSFCATVNPKEFLNDDTGSRRFWIVRSEIDLDRVIALDEPWLRQLWAQVYETMYLPNPQGFRLTREEQKVLQANNEAFSKPMPGEVDILDKLNFDAPNHQWKWKSVTDITEAIGHGYNSVQISKVLTKLCKLDERVQLKNVHNRKQYLVPPMARSSIYHHTEDFDPVLPISG